MDHYDTIVVGTGFASSFFLLEHLKDPAVGRVLVLERGEHRPHSWHLENRREYTAGVQRTFERSGDTRKEWLFSLGFGGGSNCWWACTPRLLPNDFRMKRQYGVGRDWPVSYEEVEPYYQEVEEVMQISGPADGGPQPRSQPFPQPPHRFSDPDRLLKAAYPDLYFQQATARARVATDRRGACCANSVCSLCPVDAKFTVRNGLAEVYADPRVTLLLGAEATSLDIAGGRVRGVWYRRQQRDHAASGDLVVLGANALFNPFIMLKAGIEHPLLGRRLHEQVSVTAHVLLDGVDNFQGSTAITGQGYMLYDGPHRAKHAAALIEGWNRPHFRPELRKLRQRLELKLIFEVLPDERNRVELSSSDPDRPVAHYEEHGAYTDRAFAAAKRTLPGMLSPLPVEDLRFDPALNSTEAHILGTTIMGHDPADSVLDAGLVHHVHRNLVVVGGGAFPTGPPANPTLTIAALALRAARLLGKDYRNR